MGASDDFDAAVLSEQERNLRHYNIEYQRRADGTLVVPGYIDLSYKNLTVLPNFSGVIVEGDFFCYNNQLTSLEGAPAFVGRRCGVSNNRLTTLKGAPESVGEDFWCTGNYRLTSLEHCPKYIGNTLGCQENPALENLEHAPRTFKQIQSPFGDFKSWGEVPDHLAPETKARYTDDLIRESTILQAPVAISAPLHLRRRA
ncbi:MAG: hypothetical protein ACAH83_03010 [Alphaproteobacteria bacterium]